MSGRGQIEVLVRYRMEQAEETLASAHVMVEGGFYRGALNRAYYAMFYAMLALLAIRGLGSSQHKGALTLFDREYVKTGLLPRETSRWIRSAFQDRLEADYEELLDVSATDAQDVLRNARAFLDQANAVLPDLLDALP